MNVEENRLRSFSSWPTNAPIGSERLARGGFFATGNLLETECHWCHKKISDWQYGDQIVARHRRLNPLCAFIISPNESGNVPLSPNSLMETVHETVDDSNTSIISAGQIDFKNELHRLATFKNWPNPNISPQSLSKAGFYYLNQSDQVKCAWCNGVIAEWEKNDNAFEEHQRFFPDCPRVQLGPLIEIASDGIRDLGIQQLSPPKKLKYSCLDTRLRTYTNWPITDIQKPETLAQAGFYYTDIDDHVRCFHCTGGLRSWQKEDDPWFDHAKWFPNCHFVKLVKGPQYIIQVQGLASSQMSQNVCETVQGRTMSLDEALCTPPVLLALEMGLNAGSVRNVTRRHLENFGLPYDTNEDLVEAVLSDQANEDEQTVTRELSRLSNSFIDRVNQDATTGEDQSSPTADTENSHIPSSTSTSPEVQTPLPSCIPSSSHQTTIANVDSVNTVSLESLESPVPGPSNWIPKIPNKKPVEGPNDDKSLSLEEENRKLKDARLCKVCMDEEVGVVFLPCGHLVTCVQCAPGVTQCPLCRTAIKGFVRTFLS